MKKCLLSVLALLFVFGGIYGCKLDPADELIIKNMARRVAYYVGMNNPELKAPGIVVCETILATEDGLEAQELLEMAIDKAMESAEVSDPWIIQDIKDLMRLLNITRDGNITGEVDLGMLKVVAQGIKEGLEGPR